MCVRVCIAEGEVKRVREREGDQERKTKSFEITTHAKLLFN